MSSLRGKRVFLLEDESLVAMLLEDMLDELGLVVAGTAESLGEAEAKIATLSFDVAVLDVNLNGTKSLPLAERLWQAGKPFVFSTGYGPMGMPAFLADVPVITKPFGPKDLKSALSAALL